MGDIQSDVLGQPSKPAPRVLTPTPVGLSPATVALPGSGELRGTVTSAEAQEVRRIYRAAALQMFPQDSVSYAVATVLMALMSFRNIPVVLLTVTGQPSWMIQAVLNGARAVGYTSAKDGDLCRPYTDLWRADQREFTRAVTYLTTCLPSEAPGAPEVPSV